MSVAAKALEKAGHLLVDHRVPRDSIVEISFLDVVGQFAVKQKIAGFEKIPFLGDLGDRIAAVEQNAFVAIDVSDLGFATCRRSETGIIRKHPSLGVKFSNIYN